MKIILGELLGNFPSPSHCGQLRSTCPDFGGTLLNQNVLLNVNLEAEIRKNDAQGSCIFFFWTETRTYCQNLPFSSSFFSFPGREGKMEVLLLGLNSQKDNVILRRSLRKLLWKLVCTEPVLAVRMLKWSWNGSGWMARETRIFFSFYFFQCSFFEHFLIVANEPASTNLVPGAAMWLLFRVPPLVYHLRPTHPSFSGSFCWPDPCCHYFREFSSSGSWMEKEVIIHISLRSRGPEAVNIYLTSDLLPFVPRLKFNLHWTTALSIEIKINTWGLVWQSFHWSPYCLALH